jgi:hypothetical protein
MVLKGTSRGVPSAGALAARLARTVYHLWRKQKAFDVTKFLAS